MAYYNNIGRGLKVTREGKDLKNSKGLVDTNPWWTERSHENHWTGRSPVK